MPPQPAPKRDKKGELVLTPSGEEMVFRPYVEKAMICGFYTINVMCYCAAVTFWFVQPVMLNSIRSDEQINSTRDGELMTEMDSFRDVGFEATSWFNRFMREDEVSYYIALTVMVLCNIWILLLWPSFQFFRGREGDGDWTLFAQWLVCMGFGFVVNACCWFPRPEVHKLIACALACSCSPHPSYCVSVQGYYQPERWGLTMAAGFQVGDAFLAFSPRLSFWMISLYDQSLHVFESRGYGWTALRVVVFALLGFGVCIWCLATREMFTFSIYLSAGMAFVAWHVGLHGVAFYRRQTEKNRRDHMRNGVYGISHRDSEDFYDGKAPDEDSIIVSNLKQSEEEHRRHSRSLDEVSIGSNEGYDSDNVIAEEEHNGHAY